MQDSKDLGWVLLVTCLFQSRFCGIVSLGLPFPVQTHGLCFLFAVCCLVWIWSDEPCLLASWQPTGGKPIKWHRPWLFMWGGPPGKDGWFPWNSVEQCSGAGTDQTSLALEALVWISRDENHFNPVAGRLDARISHFFFCINYSNTPTLQSLRGSVSRRVTRMTFIITMAMYFHGPGAQSQMAESTCKEPGSDQTLARSSKARVMHLHLIHPWNHSPSQNARL